MTMISTTDARALYTKRLIAVYSERPRPTMFLRSLFKVVEEPTKELSIEVQRGTERIAVDVERGTEGNRNQFSRSTEKIFVPPYYSEYFDMTQLDLYDALFLRSEVDAAIFNAFLNQVVDKMMMLTDMIERSIEVQCKQVLEDGIVQLRGGVNIDYKRKAESLVDVAALSGGARAWSVANDLTCTPYDDIQDGCIFIRTKGRTTSAMFDCIMGSDVISTFLQLPQVKSRQDLFNLKLDDINAPIRNGEGGVLHGIISAGPYKVRLWSYPEYYDAPQGTTPETYVQTQYVDPKKFILVPENPKFVLGYAAVPQVMPEGGVMPVQGAYVFDEEIDRWEMTHKRRVRTAPLAIPVAIDTIYTAKVIAG